MGVAEIEIQLGAAENAVVAQRVALLIKPEQFPTLIWLLAKPRLDKSPEDL